MKTPVLETERMILRPLTRQDAGAAWLWTSDREVNEYMNYLQHKTLQDTSDWLLQEEEAQESGNIYDFGFVRKDTGELIGSGGLSFNNDYNMWEIGYNLRRDCWNQGYTSEAVGAILQFGKMQLRIHRFFGRHAKENPASGRVLEKNGFLYVKDSFYKKADGSRTFHSREYLLNVPQADFDAANRQERSEIERFYDEEYEEWERLSRHMVEFEVTKRYLKQYITGHKKILDVGGGPGRYSIFLTQLGHEVTLLDLSGKNIRQAVEKAAEAGVHLDSCIHGDALRLSEYLYKKEQFDVVLLMGPLYHLLLEEDRKLALREALGMLKPGGLIITAFISTYAQIQDYAGQLHDFGDIDHLLHYLEDGRNHEKDAIGFTTSYFSSEEEARKLMQQAKVTELAFAGVENILCGREDKLQELEPLLREKWLELAWRLSRDEKLFGMSQHFLYIGKK